MAITDFLKTPRSNDELATALAVLREFKACESQEEWLAISFGAWVKLEGVRPAYWESAGLRGGGDFSVSPTGTGARRD